MRKYVSDIRYSQNSDPHCAAIKFKEFFRTENTTMPPAKYWPMVSPLQVYIYRFPCYFRIEKWTKSIVISQKHNSSAQTIIFLQPRYLPVRRNNLSTEETTAQNKMYLKYWETRITFYNTRTLKLFYNRNVFL